MCPPASQAWRLPGAFAGNRLCWPEPGPVMGQAGKEAGPRHTQAPTLSSGPADCPWPGVLTTWRIGKWTACTQVLHVCGGMRSPLALALQRIEGHGGSAKVGTGWTKGFTASRGRGRVFPLRMVSQGGFMAYKMKLHSPCRGMPHIWNISREVGVKATAANSMDDV